MYSKQDEWSNLSIAPARRENAQKKPTVFTLSALYVFYVFLLGLCGVASAREQFLLMHLLMHHVPLHTDSSSSSITSAVVQRPELSWNWFCTATPTSHTDNKGAIINCLSHTFVILMSNSCQRQRQSYHSRVQPAHPSIHTPH